MVCPRCTLLHTVPVTACQQCGYPFQSLAKHVGGGMVAHAQVKIGLAAGAGLVGILALTALTPASAPLLLSIGSYLGIAAIANSWLAVSRGDEGDWLGGTRGIIFCAALLYSLIAELARLYGVQEIVWTLPVGGQFQMNVPSPVVTELLACVLSIMDPLLATPIVRWLGDGVERTA